MPKKSKKRKSSTNSTPRTSLPAELEERLLVVWRRLGHLVDWCDDAEAWIKMFYSEVRPYRATFYWEAVADVVSEFMIDHPAADPEDVLTDCLVAMQCAPSDDDPDKLVRFRESWQEILDSSRTQIEAFIQADLELAMQEETYEMVARLYAGDYQRWKEGED